LLTASHEAWGWVLGKYDAGNPAALKRLLSGGAQLHGFPQDVMDASFKTANEIYAEISKTNALFKKMHDSVAAFRTESYQWMQVAELAFDSFMMRQRTRT
jgi:TRAP-type mannitol/chloroaromatic compound transport system substrate-binding protein